MFTKSHSWTMRPKLVFKLVILSLLKSKPIGKERAEILFLYRIFKKFDFPLGSTIVTIARLIISFGKI